MKRLFFISLLVYCSSVAICQDFRCTFSVSANTKDGNTDITRFQVMQKQIQEFINGYKWCNYIISQEERIECTMQLVIKEVITDEKYEAQLNIGLRRPVYNSSYNSSLLSLVDQFVEFTYNEGVPLIYNENSFDGNLTSVIAYYMNIFLGLDFDSFSPGAGTVYFEKAQSIVNVAQSAVEKGWRSTDNHNRNRYWLAENFLNSSYSGIHDFLYIYHRQGLDVMSDNIAMGVSSITQAMEKLRNANRQKPNLYAIYVLLDVKRDELINIYSGANENEKNKFLQIVQEIDPSNMSKYNQIKNN